ncbi:WapI family immunity protein [Amycolatopsis nivea]
MTWHAGEVSLALQVTRGYDGYQQVVIKAARECFSATRDSWLEEGDIERFAAEVHHMWQHLAGTAELNGERGTEFSVKLAMSSGGHVDIDIEINQPWATLRIEAETDQTYLPALRDGLLALR